MPQTQRQNQPCGTQIDASGAVLLGADVSGYAASQNGTLMNSRLGFVHRTGQFKNYTNPMARGNGHSYSILARYGKVVSGVGRVMPLISIGFSLDKTLEGEQGWVKLGIDTGFTGVGILLPPVGFIYSAGDMVEGGWPRLWTQSAEAFYGTPNKNPECPGGGGVEIPLV